MSPHTLISRKYEVLDLLGQGSMGVVYKVRHTRLDTIFALKMLPRELMEDSEMITRFSHEAWILARLRHDNIVQVLDIDHDETLDAHYLLMEYIQGYTLKEFLYRNGPLPLLDVLDLARQIARALACAHAYIPPIVHRDIKPSNIMIEDLSGRVVIMDFGIAKALGAEGITHSDAMLGTVCYCAPEQLRHEELDGSADVYALGMVMYEAYTGKQFFAGVSEPEVIGKVLHEAQEHDPQFNRPTPPAFAALVTKAIAKGRERRYRGMTELLRDLEICWAAVDDTGTIVLSSQPEHAQVQTVQTTHGPQEPEEQIRKLEEERQKRRVLETQARTRETREQAARDGADHWAKALFLQGVAREEVGHEHLREHHYPLAQVAYEEAVALFTRASEEAGVATLIDRVERTRQEMEAAKTGAEQYGAREKARTLYGRGLALQAHADELNERQAYQEAEHAYEEARGAFESARAIASVMELRAEAEAAQERARAAKEKAAHEGGEELAPQVFHEALLSEQQADMTLERRAFSQARELYDVAYQKYEKTRVEANKERDRQYALDARQQAQQSHVAAEEIQAERYAQEVYHKAIEAKCQGDQHCAEQRWREAREAFVQSTESFTEALQVAQRTLARQAAEAAREDARAAQASAQERRSAELFPEQFETAVSLLQEAEQTLEREDWSTARTRFENVTVLFQQVRRDAESYVQKEQAEQARTCALELREKAGAVSGWQGRRAEKRLRRGEQLLHKGQYAKAQASYEKASALFAALRARRLASVEANNVEKLAEAGDMCASPVMHRPAHALSFSWGLLLTGVVLFSLVIGLSLQKTWTNRKDEPTLPFAENLPSSRSLPVSPGEVVAKPAPLPQLTSVAEVVRYAANPSVEIQVPVLQVSRAFLDKREITVSPEGFVQEVLSDLPIGQSTYQLLLVGVPPSHSQEVSVSITYYPGWEIRRFSDRSGEAYAVAFALDGKRILSGSRDNKLKLWDVETGQNLRTFSGHRDWVNAVAFAPDDKRVLSESKDKTLKLWDVATGQVVQTFAGHKGWVNGVAFSPDGKTVLSGSDDRTLKLWDVETGQTLQTFSGHEDWVTAVAFAPDDKRVLSGSKDKTLKLWDVAAGQVVQTFSGHTDWVISVAFAPNGKTVLSGSDDHTLKLWDVATGQVVQTFAGHKGWVNGVAFSPDGKTVLSGSNDKTLKLWDIATGQAVRTFSGHRDAVKAVAFSPDGKMVASGSRDKTLKLWWAALEPQTQIAMDPSVTARERETGLP